jgi:hypothetical protein
MTNEEMISEVGRPILRPLGIAQAVFLLAFIVSPFIWIWHSWDIAWKTGLTGFIGTIVIYGVYKIAKKTVKEAVEESIEKLKENKPKSKFQERLEQMSAERGEK